MRIGWFAVGLLAMWLLPAQVLAGWQVCPGSTTNSISVDGVVTPTQTPLCYRTTTAADPPRVRASECRNGVDVLFFSDLVAGTDHTASAYPYACSQSGSLGVFTDCTKIQVDRTGDGIVDDLALNGDPAAARFGTYGLTPTWITFDLANGSAKTVEIVVACR